MMFASTVFLVNMTSVKADIMQFDTYAVIMPTPRKSRRRTNHNGQYADLTEWASQTTIRGKPVHRLHGKNY